MNSPPPLYGTRPIGAVKVLTVILILSFHGILYFADLRLYTSTHSKNGGRHATLGTTAVQSVSTNKLGVFVVKVTEADQALQSLCILDRFFNQGPKYPIRVFVDRPTSNDTLHKLAKINPHVDLQVFIDTEERWMQFPPELNAFEKEVLEKECTATECTVRKVHQGYVYMGYWRYRRMAYEDSMQGFKFFISWDSDTYLIEPMKHDPFLIMEQNNLTGFTVNDCSSYNYDQGVVEVAKRCFGADIEGRGYLNTPETFPFFRRESGKFIHRSFYGYVFGGRLDFFRTPAFREYSRQMVPFTYHYRVDEQPVIAMAWSMLAPDTVWHLPSRGYNLGVYHHSFVDFEQYVPCERVPPPIGAKYVNHTDPPLCYWVNPLRTGFKTLDFQYPGTFPQNYVDYVALMRSLNGPGSLSDCICHTGRFQPVCAE